MVEVIGVIASIIAFVLVSKNTMGLYKGLKFGMFQSVLISILFLLPTSVSIVRFLFGVLETLLIRLVFILGGTDQDEISERTAASEENDEA